MAPKRKASAAAGDAEAPSAKPIGGAAPLVDPARVRVLGAAPAAASAAGPASAAAASNGPVVYCMARDARAADNWALVHAAASAAQLGVPVCVAVCLPRTFGPARQAGFAVRGLRGTAQALASQSVPVFVLRGAPGEALPPLAAALGASLLVVDFSPLRDDRAWRDALAGAVGCPVHEVDAHNVVPAWAASPKLETAARTLRPKIHSLLPRFLAPFPAALPATRPWPGPDGAGAAAGAAALPQPPAVDWDALVGAAASDDPSVPELAWAAPGEAAGLAALAAFLAPPRLALYGTKRNDPNAPHAQSGLSPWLHAGQLSAQRCALDAAAAKRAPGGAAHAASIDSFLEELVVRKELADNFCLHQPRYDDLAGAAEWARASLAAHASDPREHVYSRAQLDGGRTADRLWNAAQQQLVHCGKLHGFLRMYWAKKVLEWGATPAAALADAIHLNDRYSLDGRDPNGYVGCMWSVAGVHDMGWKERPVFGKIRYMNFAGCKRKFDVEAYITRVGNETLRVKNAAAKASAAKAGGAAPAAAAPAAGARAAAGAADKA